jgi:hypothetical protein
LIYVKSIALGCSIIPSTMVVPVFHKLSKPVRILELSKRSDSLNEVLSFQVIIIIKRKENTWKRNLVNG